MEDGKRFVRINQIEAILRQQAARTEPAASLEPEEFASNVHHPIMPASSHRRENTAFALGAVSVIALLVLFGMTKLQKADASPSRATIGTERHSSAERTSRYDNPSVQQRGADADVESTEKITAPQAEAELAFVARTLTSDDWKEKVPTLCNGRLVRTIAEVPVRCYTGDSGIYRLVYYKELSLAESHELYRGGFNFAVENGRVKILRFYGTGDFGWDPNPSAAG